MGRSCFGGEWPEEWKKYYITVLELYPIIAALVVWGTTLANQTVEFVTDNEALVPNIKKQTSRNKQVMF